MIYDDGWKKKFTHTLFGLPYTLARLFFNSLLLLLYVKNYAVITLIWIFCCCVSRLLISFHSLIHTSNHFPSRVFICEFISGSRICVWMASNLHNIIMDGNIFAVDASFLLPFSTLRWLTLITKTFSRSKAKLYSSFLLHAEFSFSICFPFIIFDVLHLHRIAMEFILFTGLMCFHVENTSFLYFNSTKSFKKNKQIRWRF
jgi:hypothetical protein